MLIHFYISSYLVCFNKVKTLVTVFKKLDIIGNLVSEIGALPTKKRKNKEIGAL